MSQSSIPLEYKGRPLRRKDGFIYYGSMSDPYIVMIQVLEKNRTTELETATRLSVQLQVTDPTVKGRAAIVKRSDKDSLYSALDISSIWLERALSKHN